MLAFEPSTAQPAPAEPGNAAPRSLRGWIALIIKFAVSLGAIALVLSMADFNTAFRRVEAQDWFLIASAIVVMAGQLVLGAWRWHSVRRGLGIPVRFRNTLRLYLIGSFFSSYVISGVSGDIMRGWLSYKQGVDPTRTVNSIVLDRVLVLVGIAVMLLPAIPWFVMKFGSGIEGWAPALASSALFAAIIICSQAHRLPQALRDTLPGKLMVKLGQGMHAMFMQPRAALRGVATAILAQVALGCATWLLSLSLHLPVSFIDCLVIIQIVAVLNAIPISVGGWGVREIAVVGLFGLIGVASEPALILSVELGLIGLLVNLPGGPIWLTSPADQRNWRTSRPSPAGAAAPSPSAPAAE